MVNALYTQRIALTAMSTVMDDLDEKTIKEKVLPKAKSAFSSDCETGVRHPRVCSESL